jgi:hypothetical protein
MRQIPVRMQAICTSGGKGTAEMSLRVKRMAAAGLLRKAIPARGWQRFATGGVVVALAAAGAVAAGTATPAHAAHTTAHTTAASARSSTCTPPPSPYLAGFTQGNVSIPGDSIHYVIGGHGPALVLLPGWPLTWWEFHTIMPTLAKSYTVIALDLPGRRQAERRRVQRGRDRR